MDVRECIKTRRSVRRYKDTPVEWDKIVEILNAGKFAPSAGNLQNWKFIAVRDDTVRKKLAKAAFDQGWMADAPVHIVVVGEPGNAGRFYGERGEKLYTIQNCGAAIENMLLVTNDLGLGSCWVGAFDDHKVKRAVNMPAGNSPQAIITIGYADGKPNYPSRKELEHIAHLDRWGGKGQGFRAKGYTSVAMKDAVDDVKKALKRVGKNLTKDSE